MHKDKRPVINILRDKIISGEFPAGKRLAEIPTAELLGVSRTPIRIAFRALEQEGLLKKLPRRGFQVRTMSAKEITDGVEVRGVLEGLAARQATEIGLEVSIKQKLQQCLQDGDSLFTQGYLTETAVSSYHSMNKQFHSLIVEASCNGAIQAALQCNEHLPFSSVNALAFNPDQMEHEFQRLHYAHLQHHAIIDAISRGQSARAEALMKEHAHATISQAELFDDQTYRLISMTER
jgi:GntR family transcriptional regulator of vanillate catabolism